MKKMTSLGRRRPLRRRGVARLFVLGAAVAATGTTARPAAAQASATDQADAARRAAQASTFRFDIPAAPLDTVVAAFTRITGLPVAFAMPELGMIQSPGVSGTLTAAAAMRALLEGTSVSATFAASGATLGVGGVAEFVEVTGAGPAAVSSPKYLVPLRDVAQSVAVIPRKVIDEQAAFTLSDALRNVPGITLQAGEGGGASNTAGDMFNLRGFNASNSLFVDGVRDDGLIARDVYNLEQVEVFMGPTGSDVGRGTAAGYVNMQSKVPHLGSSTSASYSYGTADQHRLSADLNWAAPEGRSDRWISKSAFRLNALWQDGGFAGRDVAQRESAGVAPSLALGLGTPTRVTVSAQFMKQENVPDYGIPGAAWRDELLTPTTVLAPAAVDQSNFYGSANYDYDRANQRTLLGRIEHDLGRGTTLRNQTRYNRTDREAVLSAIQNVAAYNPASNLVTITRQGSDRENSIWSNQTSLVDRFTTGGLRHSATLGVEITREEQFAPTLAGLGTRNPVDIFNPNPNEPIAGFAPVRTLAESTGGTTTVGAYAFDTVEVSSRVQLSGGFRYDRYSTEFRAVDAAGATTTNLDFSDGVMSGKASVLVRVAPQGNLYLSWGTSVTPPGTANFTLSAQANNQNNPSTKPQESTNIELGSKWDVAGGRLSLTGAIFRTENENVIFTIDATAIPPLFNQDDGQLVKGFTLGAMGRITDRWDVLANFGYLDTEQQSQNPANDGRRMLLTPKYSSSLWTTYRLPKNVMVGGGVRHVDDVFVNAANTIKAPGYALVDALVQYAVNTNLSFRVNVSNLTDEIYIRNVNNNGGRYNPGYRRSVMLSTNVGF
jgi:catecholate siderophore receptor